MWHFSPHTYPIPPTQGVHYDLFYLNYVLTWFSRLVISAGNPKLSMKCHYGFKLERIGETDA
jgi:hypothetical protein